MEKQTAVEWLESHLIEYGFDLSAHKFETQKAKEMEEKQQEALAIGFGEWLNTEQPLALIYDLTMVGELPQNIQIKDLLEIYKTKNFVDENEMKNPLFDQEPKFKLNSFCETPQEKCTINYCDENGCQNRVRNLVEPKQEIKMELDALKLIAESYGFELTEKKREIKVGDFGKFWEDDEDEDYSFGFLIKIDENHFFSDNDTAWYNFSHLTDEEKANIQENW
jgi:hypothetical protein